VVTQLSWPNKMRRSEKRTKNDAKTTNNNISDAQERVLAAHYCACGNEHFLCAAVEEDVEFWYIVSMLAVCDKEERSAPLQISTWYLPLLIIFDLSSCRSDNLLKVGNPAVLIQTWKASSVCKSGSGLESL
jgi:hypothetical protein